MADKSVFSLEIETETSDRFKTNFDDYSKKLQGTLAAWKRAATQIDDAKARKFREQEGRVRRVLAVLVGVIVSCLSVNEALAVVRKMECREWLDKDYRGLYTFTFDTEQELLSVAYKPEGKYPLDGQKVEKWILIWQKDLDAVFYGIAADDWAGPVRMLSLHFGDVQMFPYSLGSKIEGDTLVSKIERRCRRLD